MNRNLEPMEGSVLSFLKQNERWATQAKATESLVIIGTNKFKIFLNIIFNKNITN